MIWSKLRGDDLISGSLSQCQFLRTSHITRPREGAERDSRVQAHTYFMRRGEPTISQGVK